MDSQTIIFLSNGYAEDNIACCIIENLLKERPSLKIRVMPFVGEGISYKKLGVEVLEPCKRMPSDGFISGDLFYLLRDLKAGLLKLYREKIRVLKTQTGAAKLLVCVGDIFLVLISALFIKKPIVFLPTAKSDYIKEHYFVEKWLMRRFCRLVVPRDEVTALSLKNSGINAVYVGNVMMDCLRITGEDFDIDKRHPVVAIIPGSKEEAYDNLMVALDAAREISLQSKVNFLIALAPSLNLEKIAANLLKKNCWKIQIPQSDERKKGIVANLISSEGAIVKVVQGRFGDVVNLSKVVIGTAGMANEQAVGLGKPVVSFPGKGPQITKRFLLIQRKLLGGAIFIVEKNAKAIAAKVTQLLEDSEKLSVIEKIGKERMGEPGAASRVAKLIYEELVE